MANTSEKIVKWIIARPALNLSVIAREVGYSRQNLEKALKGERNIPDGRLSKFETVLKKYGYV